MDFILDNERSLDKRLVFSLNIRRNLSFQTRISKLLTQIKIGHSQHGNTPDMFQAKKFSGDIIFDYLKSLSFRAPFIFALFNFYAPFKFVYS